jgi:glycosyltransferase involved in cell wall biosynthesis
MYHSLVTLGWALQTKKPYMVSPHGMLEPWAWRHNAWKKRPVWWAWEKRNVESAAVLQATAYEEAANLRALGLRNPIAIIPNGVDIPKLRPLPHQKEVRTALFISRIHPKKGLLNLVKAWALLRPKDWRMVIAGPSEGGHEAEVKKAVIEAGLENQFEFPGPVYEGAKWDLYNQADLFVLPTYSENFGVVVAEALAAAVPVITTKGAPWHELIEYNCGWWVDVGIDHLVTALREAFALSDNERQEMGLRGRTLVQEKYSWPTIATEMASVYRWILGVEAKPDCIFLD